MGEGERPRFEPPTADPPRYGEGAPPAPPASPPPAGPPRVPGRNYSSANPGGPRSRSSSEPSPPSPPEPANALAVASISLGVLGLLLLVTFFGSIIVNLPCSIGAWALGVRARSRPGPRSMAQAGMVTGIVGTALGALALVAWAVLGAGAD